MSNELTENPRKWRFTWEAQSLIPILRLLIFDSKTNPSVQRENLKVSLDLSRSLVTVSWFQDYEVSLWIPVPRVLIDDESPLSFRAFDDHIEVKLVLLLPADHPIVLNFDSLLNLSDDGENEYSVPAQPLTVDSDQNSLSSSGGVEFYCRKCSFKVTNSPIRNFVEMPSVDWREVADNWFGSCCCSFGGAGEKLVTRYTNSYTCGKGTCLLTSTTITLSKDDLVGDIFPLHDGIHGLESESDFTINNDLTESKQDSESDNNAVTKETRPERFNDRHLDQECSHDEESHDLCHVNRDCTHHVCGISPEDGKPAKIIEIKDNQKPFLNGFLGNIFMVRLSYLTSDIEWIEYLCPHCSSLLGAYPCKKNSYAPLDGGVRIFKCYVSTCLPIGGSRDLFRNYTLERMFANQLLQSAKDESSFRTVIKDLKTKSPILQIVLINSNSWCYNAYCLDAQGATEPVPKIDLLPIIKVLYTVYSESAESQLRTMEEWLTKDLADEAFMFTHQIEDLIKVLASRQDVLPPSYSILEGSSLSSIPR